MRKSIVFSLIAILLFTGRLEAQDSEVGTWYIYTANIGLAENWAIHSEIQYRNYNIIGDLEQLLLRGGLQYKFKDEKSSLTLGYGYILSEPYAEDGEKLSIPENRIYQEFKTVSQWGSVLKASHRYRFEQRFVDDNDIAFRFRYALGIQLPITKKTIAPKSLYGAFYNEVFLNVDEEVFDRNRIYLGLGYMLSESHKIQLGYMSQVFNDGQRGQINISVNSKF